MVKHLILWKLKETAEPDKIKAGIKSNLEGLAGKIPGLLSIRVVTAGLPSSNVDVMLETSFTDAEALKNYAVNPLHTAVADTYVRPYTAGRYCLDYELN